MKTKMLIPILTLILSVLISCDANEPQVERNTLKLSLIDVSVREAYLHIEAEKIRDNEDIVLFRNGKEVLSFKNTRKDTTITDTALTENTSYKYIVYSRSNNVETARSEEVSVTTLMSTSHEFSWQTYTFGDNDYTNYNVLRDVAIVNENDIWAVGEVYLNDSLGRVDDENYGAVHWEGNNWKFMKVPIRDYSTLPFRPGVISSIDIINDKVYVSSGGNLMKYENSKWDELALFIQDPLHFNGQVREIWGRDENNIYCAGLNGSIYHVTKSHIWNKLPYESKYAVMDIWGFTNPLTGKDEIYCPLLDWDNSYKSKLLKITEDVKINEAQWNENNKTSTVWTNKGFPVYAADMQMFENSKSKWQEVKLENVVSMAKIRGSKLNNIAAAGVGSIVHYNGKDWRVYNADNCVFYSIDIKDNIIAAVGYKGSKAVIMIGKR